MAFLTKAQQRALEKQWARRAFKREKALQPDVAAPAAHSPVIGGESSRAEPLKIQDQETET